MRILLIPALMALLSSTAFAKGGHSDWKYQPRPIHRSEVHHSCPEPEFHGREDRGHSRFDRRRSWNGRRPHHPHPVPPAVHVRPLPLPPPPVGIHLWFGF